MADERRKDINWRIHTNMDGSSPNSDAQLAVLMDIRDELKQQSLELRKLNNLLHCRNFTAIPDILRTIRKNTTKKRKPKVVAKPRLRAVS